MSLGEEVVVAGDESFDGRVDWWLLSILQRGRVTMLGPPCNKTLLATGPGPWVFEASQSTQHLPFPPCLWAE